MNIFHCAWFVLPAAIALLSAIGPQDPTPAPAVDPRVMFFEAKVRPLLISRCDECHAETAEGNLRVDSREALLKGGDEGPAIVVGDPEASLLIRAVRHTDKLKMPKTRTRLTEVEIEALAQWIKDGAVWPAATPAAPSVIQTRIAQNRDFWSFRPLALPAVPAVTDTAWPRTDLDRFLLSRL